MKKAALVFCILAQLGLQSAPVHAEENSASGGSASPAPSDMIIVTTSSVDGYYVKEYRGIVRGVTVRQPTIGQSLTAGFQKLAGGKINSYVAMAEKARQTAFDLAVTKARELGANALIGVKYDSTSCDNGGQPVTEVLCYGTAVLVEKVSK